jgi:NADH:ubiquinone oxidoreductase subunit F (NADH-binding)
VIALPAAACPIAETARVIRYLAEESAGQCGPCLFGLPALADALASLAYCGTRDRDLDEVTALVRLIEGRGACRHPDGATQLVRSLLRAFPADTQWHQWQGACDGVRRPPLLPLPGDEKREWDWT